MPDPTTTSTPANPAKIADIETLTPGDNPHNVHNQTEGQPNAEEPKTPPTPNADDPTFQDRVKSLIEDARREEKDKLYPLVEQLKERNRTLAAENKNLRASRVEEALTEGTPDPAPQPSPQSQPQPQTPPAQPSGDGNKGTNLDSLPDALRQMVEGVLTETVAPLVDTVNQLSSENVQTKRELLRSQVLDVARAEAAAQGEGLIESLVVGDTVEELTQAADLARQEWRKVMEQAGFTPGQSPAPAPTPGNRTLNPPSPNSSVNGRTRQPQLTVQDIRNIPIEQWSEFVKAGIKDKVFAQEGIQPGPKPQIAQPGHRTVTALGVGR